MASPVRAQQAADGSAMMVIVDHSGDRVIAGRYELRAVLGRGGVGTVWRGHDRLLDREVAVKEVRLGASGPVGETDETVRARLVREARAAAGLAHPRIVTIFDIAIDDEVAHLVMELVDAPSLSARVAAGGPLHPTATAQVTADVGSALLAAHAAGIVHRDVKPGNVLVTDDGTATLTDFGIAAVGDQADLTMTGLVIGSPGYMAPEQALGHRAGPATDVWGLAATAYFAVEGVAPFVRNGPIPTLAAVTSDPPRPPERAGALSELLLRALAKEPEQRPELADWLHDVAQLAEDAHPSGAATRPAGGAPVRAVTAAVPTGLDSAVPDDATQHDAEGPMMRAVAGGERRRFVAVAAVTAAVVIVAGAVVVSMLGGPDTEDPVTAGTPVTGTAPDEGADDAPAADTDTDVEAADPPPAGTDDGAPDDGGDGPDDGAAGDEDDDPDGSGEDDDPDGNDENNDADGSDEADATIPEGWTELQMGFSGATVAHPAAWQPEVRTPFRVDAVAPDGATYLRTEYTDTPGDDAVADWQRQSAAFGSGRQDYEEVRIVELDIPGADTAALWEYRWTDSGTGRRALNLAIVTNGRGYALNLVTDADRWEDVAPVFEGAVDSFRPGPAPD